MTIKQRHTNWQKLRSATSSREQTGDAITFAQFEEGNILTETRNDIESGDESDN